MFLPCHKCHRPVEMEGDILCESCYQASLQKCSNNQLANVSDDEDSRPSYRPLTQGVKEQGVRHENIPLVSKRRPTPLVRLKMPIRIELEKYQKKHRLSTLGSAIALLLKNDRERGDQ